MTKQENQEDPNSCWNKAHPDEPIFILLARDDEAYELVREWRRRRIKSRKNKPEDPEMRQALTVAIDMEYYNAAKKR